MPPPRHADQCRCRGCEILPRLVMTSEQDILYGTVGTGPCGTIAPTVVNVAQLSVEAARVDKHLDCQVGQCCGDGETCN